MGFAMRTVPSHRQRKEAEANTAHAASGVFGVAVCAMLQPSSRRRPLPKPLSQYEVQQLL